MSDIAVSINNVSKAYLIGTQRMRATTVAEACAKILHGDLRRADGRQFLALRDLSLEVKRGEILGIIGRNGAGKTTLLKILCRITEPTSGQIDLYGQSGACWKSEPGFIPS